MDTRTMLAGMQPSGLRVLVVDDDVDVAVLMSMTLQASGHAVTICHDGYRALSHLREAVPDVVVLDLMMPGTSGIEVMERLDLEGIAVPVVMITAIGVGPLTRRAHHLGARAVVQKPFGLDEFVGVVETAGAAVPVARAG